MARRCSGLKILDVKVPYLEGGDALNRLSGELWVPIPGDAKARLDAALGR